MTARLYDAHNHLQDDRFGGRQAALLAACRAAGVVRMVVNGSCEGDWAAVLDLARTERPLVVPSFGIHPWYVHTRVPGWEQRLAALLGRVPSGLGEIGLDRWKPGLAYEGQEEVFSQQMRMAAERNVPASIHCLKAWGRLYDLLRAGPRPACGFLLHSYGGSLEMVRPLADLGAYFSMPGYYAHERKGRQREVFRAVPPERFLLETDAPDQLLPERLNLHPLVEVRGRGALNHPANLEAVHGFAAGLLGCPPAILADRVEANFNRLFGGVVWG